MRPPAIHSWTMALEYEWTQYALSQYPKEAVAYVVDGRLVPVTNHSTNAEHEFSISLLDRVRVESMGEVQALLHTHPYRVEQSSSYLYPIEWPSGADMRYWMMDNIPWGIWSTDGAGLSHSVWMHHRSTVPLVGREFIHGVQDCYSVIRDWYWQKKGIDLPNYARAMEWWNDGVSNLYEDGFADAGFRELEGTESLEVGDVLLMRVFGSVISHAGVVVGTDKMIHHPFSKNGTALSVEDSVHRWRRLIVKRLRYKNEK